MSGNLVAEWKVVKVDGWYPREEALESIERARKRFSERSSSGAPA
jgi:inorganic pyrophosphatase